MIFVIRSYRNRPKATFEGSSPSHQGVADFRSNDEGLSWSSPRAPRRTSSSSALARRERGRTPLREAGLRVVCIEQGDWPDYSTSRVADEYLELRPASSGTRSRRSGRRRATTPIDTTRLRRRAADVERGRRQHRAVRGMWLRLLPSDFRVRTLDGVADDWPLTYEDLRPFYERIEGDFGVSGWRATRLCHPGPGRRCRPCPWADGPSGRAGAQPARLALVAGVERDRDPRYGDAAAVRAARRLHVGLRGRRQGPSTVTHWPDAIAGGVRLLTGARARRVVLEPTGLATGVEWVDPTRVTRHLTRPMSSSVAATASARRGCSALREQALSERARQLLRPGRQAPHAAPLRHVIGVLRRRPRPCAGGLGPALLLPGVLRDRHRPRLRPRRQVGTAPRPVARQSMTAALPVGRPVAVGRRLPRHRGGRLGRSLAWGIVAEDLPEGQPGRTGPTPPPIRRHPRAEDRLPDVENTQRSARLQRRPRRRVAAEAGAYETIVAPLIRATGWHISAPRRWDRTARSSVVDQWGRAHDVPNLFIVDGSTGRRRRG